MTHGQHYHNNNFSSIRKAVLINEEIPHNGKKRNAYEQQSSNLSFKLVSLSNEETIANPKFNEQVKRRKTIRARRASHKKKGSKNRQKAYQSLAKLEQKTANKRADFQWKVAHKIANLGDVIVFEDLNIKGMIPPNPPY